MSTYLVAHDLGTSGDKATLFTTDGLLVNSVTVGYKTNYFNSNWAEQNPEDWWRAFCLANRQLLADIDKDRIAGLAFSGQMMGCVPVDKNGQALRNAIIWADQRSQAQESYLRQQIDEWDFYKITGHKISSSYSLEKLMWIRDNETEIFAHTYKMLQPKDYLIYRLTGEFVTDYSDASGTNCFDLNSFQWSQHILDLAGISMELLPDIYPSTHIAGIVRKAVSDTCALNPGTKIIIGAGDGVCAAVGAGSVHENAAFNYLGSSAWIAYTSRSPVYDPLMRTYNWAHMIPGYITPNGTMQAAGNSYQFVKDLLFSDVLPEADLTKSSIHCLIDKAIRSSPVGANGLLYLPYLLGERSPRWNSNARGAFVGLKMEHQKGDLLRACIEGVALNLCIILDVFRSNTALTSMNVIGGLAQSKVILQILADVYGMPLVPLRQIKEATSMGAAVAAGVGTGTLSGFDSIDLFIQTSPPIIPDKHHRQQYQAIANAFEQCYQALLPVYETIHTL